jgi:hypothetical protein
MTKVYVWHTWWTIFQPVYINYSNRSACRWLTVLFKHKYLIQVQSRYRIQMMRNFHESSPFVFYILDSRNITVGQNWKLDLTDRQSADHSGCTRSNTRTVFSRSNAEITCSNPTESMDVYVRLFCVCVVLCAGSRHATFWSPVQGVPPTVYRIKKLKSGQGSQGL